MLDLLTAPEHAETLGLLEALSREVWHVMAVVEPWWERLAPVLRTRIEPRAGRTERGSDPLRP